MAFIDMDPEDEAACPSGDVREWFIFKPKGAGDDAVSASRDPETPSSLAITDKAFIDMDFDKVGFTVPTKQEGFIINGSGKHRITLRCGDGFFPRDK